MTGRAEFIEAVKAQAWDAGKDCPHCDGTGTIRPGRRIVHCAMSFTGADWDEQSVLDLIKTADQVLWLDGPGDHQLGIFADGRRYRFQVQHPFPPLNATGPKPEDES